MCLTSYIIFLGQEQFYIQASLVLVRLCQTFEFIERAVDIQSDVLPVARPLLFWKDGIWLRFKPAEETTVIQT